MNKVERILNYRIFIFRNTWIGRATVKLGEQFDINGKGYNMLCNETDAFESHKLLPQKHQLLA